MYNFKNVQIQLRRYSAIKPKKVVQGNTVIDLKKKKDSIIQ